MRVVNLDVRLGEFGPEATSKWSLEEFWQMCAKVPELPETSSPSPGAFEEAFRSLADEGAAGVVCVALSSVLSATYQAALLGVHNVADRIGVRVVDSLAGSVAEGLVALDAVAVAEAGGDLDAVEAAAMSSRDLVRLYGTLDSLDNLRKGGRLRAGQALLGGLLDIKPVLMLRNGALELESRARTRLRSFERVAAIAREVPEIEQLGILHAGASDIDVIVGMLAEVVPRERIKVGWLGPVLGAHVGGGTIVVGDKRRAQSI
jgi:DegV family protein with EDD domain